uniref:CrV1 n=1 Tax=Ascaris lumbricoides TaxID=6252 RepID=A0A0M3HMJ2_ASCLU
MHLFLFSVFIGCAILNSIPSLNAQRLSQSEEHKNNYLFEELQPENAGSSSFSPFSLQRRNARTEIPIFRATNEFPDLLISTGDSPIESETIFEEAEVPERYEKEVAMSSLMSNATALNTLADDLAEDLQSTITKELYEQLAI